MMSDTILITDFNSTSGMNTRFWGPAGWKFFFTSILGSYPIKLDNTNKEHIVIKTNFKNMLTSLGYTMPCIFCRESFKDFLKELPIEPFLVGRIELMHWLYLIKNKVNQKLINQERVCYNNEKKRLKILYKNGEISKSDYYICVKKFKNENSYTKPAPPFVKVLKYYERQRAVCSKQAKKCILKK